MFLKSPLEDSPLLPEPLQLREGGALEIMIENWVADIESLRTTGIQHTLYSGSLQWHQLDLKPRFDIAGHKLKLV
ncbi:hypothetical protein TNCV_870691 [Trichonephila clavipes]|nr:hypothetical protein TNCV_870691 [Trichonephila clavipes]